MVEVLSEEVVIMAVIVTTFQLDCCANALFNSPYAYKVPLVIITITPPRDCKAAMCMLTYVTPLQINLRE